MMNESVFNAMNSLLTQYSGTSGNDEEFVKKIELLCTSTGDANEKKCYQEVAKHIRNKAKIRDGEKILLIRVKKDIDKAVSQIPESISKEDNDLIERFMKDVVIPIYDDEIKRWSQTPLNGFCRNLMQIFQEEVFAVWNARTV